MPWVKCSERMPDISDKTSVDASNCFVVRFPLPDNNWEIGVMREKDFDKFGIPSSNYEWFEGLLDEEPKPTRQEIVDIVKETIEGSIPYVVRHYAFLITADSWNKLARIAKPELTVMFDLLDKVGTGVAFTEEEKEQALKILEG